MPQVHFTPNLQRHVECPPASVKGQTVAEVLETVFATNPKVRSYIVDEQGCLRKHMVIFVDGRAVQDRFRLSDPVTDNSEVYVYQALSGG